MRIVVVMILASFLQGCALNAYHNVELTGGKSNSAIKASYNVKNRPGSNEDTLVLLALSGGGSRAAYFSSSVMLSLGKIDLLKQIDVISSVSGGSLPAAYYAVSTDPNTASPGDRVWEEVVVKKLMQKNYTMRWFGNWFWPTNIARYWFTAYNRSHIMAQTFSDNLFDDSISGLSYTFRDIKSDRPTLIINSTNATRGQFSELFSFTQEDFDSIHSDLGAYEIAMAVMASACFPSVFNYMNLKDYSDNDKYFHVFDGGNSDNLGLLSVFAALDNSIGNYKKIVLILVDSYTKSNGVSNSVADGREMFDYVLDSNFLDSFDCLLSHHRDSLIEDMINYFNYLKKNRDKEVVFYHIKFDSITALKLPNDYQATLFEQVNAIKTDFQIDKENAKYLDELTGLLINGDNSCLQKITGLLANEKHQEGSIYCTWPALAEDDNRIHKASAKVDCLEGNK
jgi:NTE family protein